MSTDSPTGPPRMLPEQIDALRADLAAASYLSATIEQLLGPVAADALQRANPVPADRVLAARDEPAALLLRLFTLGAVVPRAQVEAALPALGLDGAMRLGLVELAPTTDADGAVRALLELAPYSASDDAGQIDWWIASDLSELATGRPLGPEHVLGVGGASLTLARITPRAHVARVLDLGCGGGIQALHASRHAEHVVATDLSERALAVAAFNAALNGIEIELRQGSLLDPVAGEDFDLIVSNPPFVITPRDPAAEATTWTYRDGRRAGDTLLAELVRALPAHLSPGGSAVMLGNWEITDPAEWDAHPRAWLQDAAAEGVDAWVLQREQEDPAQYAETWVRDGGITTRDPDWAPLVGAWLDDFDRRGVEQLGFGYLLLRRPVAAAPRPGVLRTEQAPGTGSGTLAEHLAASLRAMGTLATLDDAALAAARPVRAADVVERRHLTPGQWDPMLIELVQGAGFARSVRVDQQLAATVGALDGTLTLAQVVGAVCALTEAEEETLERVLAAVRELIRTGMVTL
ncbi:methyltransferase [Brachybacterium vulturis]|uniref:Methyltransferase n=1 Tax=Brachybacterium vulturis TaxID=2017484 RepID=A0A291GM01_9MICO|nr:methyltransferase [Brachybacterium vulturis]ATG51066.1 methyltransferase [Brachybacterium vulturis]